VLEDPRGGWAIHRGGDAPPQEAMEAFDFAGSGAVGSRTPDCMTASLAPLPQNMYDLMIVRGHCVAAGGLPAGTCDRTLCLVMAVYYTKTIHSPAHGVGVCRKRWTCGSAEPLRRERQSIRISGGKNRKIRFLRRTARYAG
jgi:hypothetical protein